MPYLIPDTNFFLQCQSIESIDWSLATPDGQFVLAIPRTVQREIDQHKGGNNTRRASRARAAVSLFAKILDVEAGEVIIDGRNCKIAVQLLKPRLRAENYPDLDLNDNDDRIVAEAIWVAEQWPSDTVTLVTGDVPVMATAKAHNVPFFKTPEAWLLKPEPDPKDKEIAELKRRLDVHEKNTPSLVFEAREVTSEPFDIVHYGPLDDNEVDELVRVAESLWPMRTDFSPKKLPPNVNRRQDMFGGAIRMNQPPHPIEIQRYQEIAYPNWVSSIRKELASIHNWLNRPSLEIWITLSNVGGKPAESLLVEAKLSGNASFVNRDQQSDEHADSVPISTPPHPPKMRSTLASMIVPGGLHDPFGRKDLFRHMASLSVPIARHDPEAFYRLKGKEADNYSAFSCDTFRHRHDKEEFRFCIRPAVPETQKCGAMLLVTTHAANVPQRTELSIPLRFTITQGDTASRARALFDECIHEIATRRL